MTHSNSEPIFIGPNGSDTEVTAKAAGSKAAMLWRMGRLGLAVPPAFVMPSSLCAPVNGDADAALHALDQGLRNGIAYLEKVAGRRFGDGRLVARLSSLWGREIHAGDAGDNSRCRTEPRDGSRPDPADRKPTPRLGQFPPFHSKLFRSRRENAIAGIGSAPR